MNQPPTASPTPVSSYYMTPPAEQSSSQPAREPLAPLYSAGRLLTINVPTTGYSVSHLLFSRCMYSNCREWVGSMCTKISISLGFKWGPNDEIPTCLPSPVPPYIAVHSRAPSATDEEPIQLERQWRQRIKLCICCGDITSPAQQCQKTALLDA